jgi:hypothetical protein
VRLRYGYDEWRLYGIGTGYHLLTFLGLRSATSLVQTIGSTARNVKGTAILYADRMTDSVTKAIGETNRRRRECRRRTTPSTGSSRPDDHQGHREPAAAAVQPRLPRRGVRCRRRVGKVDVTDPASLAKAIGGAREADEGGGEAAGVR